MVGELRVRPLARWGAAESHPAPVSRGTGRMFDVIQQKLVLDRTYRRYTKEPGKPRRLFLFRAFRHAKRTVPEGRGEPLGLKMVPTTSFAEKSDQASRFSW